MSNSFETLVDLNNAGVSHFECMRIPEAKTLFRKGIDLIYELLADAPSSVKKATSSRKPQATSSSPAVPILAGWSNTPASKTHGPQTDVYIFTRTAKMSAIPYEPSLIRVYLSLALYNLAVTVHVEATHNRISKHFKAASRLYDMSFNMLKRTGCLQEGTEFDMMMISTLNNSGAIFYSELGRYKDAQRCFGSVSKLLSSRPFSSTLVLNDAEVTDLLMNLYVQGVKAAPAA